MHCRLNEADGLPRRGRPHAQSSGLPRSVSGRRCPSALTPPMRFLAAHGAPRVMRLPAATDPIWTPGHPGSAVSQPPGCGPHASVLHSPPAGPTPVRTNTIPCPRHQKAASGYIRRRKPWRANTPGPPSCGTPPPHAKMGELSRSNLPSVKKFACGTDGV